MLISFVVLGLIEKTDGGAGAAKLYGMSRMEGFSYSKYRIKSTIKDLLSIGAIAKCGSIYCLTLLGANLVAADIAAANGHEVLLENDIRMTMPVYAKGLL